MTPGWLALTYCHVAFSELKRLIFVRCRRQSASNGRPLADDLRPPERITQTSDAMTLDGHDNDLMTARGAVIGDRLINNMASETLDSCLARKDKGILIEWTASVYLWWVCQWADCSGLSQDGRFQKAAIPVLRRLQLYDNIVILLASLYQTQFHTGLRSIYSRGLEGGGV